MCVGPRGDGASVTGGALQLPAGANPASRGGARTGAVLSRSRVRPAHPPGRKATEGSCG